MAVVTGRGRPASSRHRRLAGPLAPLWIAAAVVLASVAWEPPAQAEEPFTGPLLKTWGLPGGFEHMWLAYRRGIEGDCGQLLRFVVPPVGFYVYLSYVVRGEMYDRGICFEFDPQAAFESFQAAAEEGYVPANLVLGWKYTHGHGVEQSDEKAKAAFKRYIGTVSYPPGDTNSVVVVRALQDRVFPDELVAAIAWLEDMKADQPRMIAFARGLIDGTARYHDGTTFEADPDMAHRILDFMVDAPEAWYWLGIEGLGGAFGSDRVDHSRSYLRRAAFCRYVPAMLALAKGYERGEHGFLQWDIYAHAWYIVAERHGANVEEDLARIDSWWFPYQRRWAEKYADMFLGTMSWCPEDADD